MVNWQVLIKCTKSPHPVYEFCKSKTRIMLKCDVNNTAIRPQLQGSHITESSHEALFVPVCVRALLASRASLIEPTWHKGTYILAGDQMSELSKTMKFIDDLRRLNNINLWTNQIDTVQSMICAREVLYLFTFLKRPRLPSTWEEVERCRHMVGIS